MLQTDSNAAPIELGAWRAFNANFDSDGLAVISDGIGPDGLPLDVGEVLLVNRSATVSTGFGPTKALAVVGLGLAGAGGVLAASSRIRLRLGTDGTLWLVSLTAGSLGQALVYFR